MLLDTKPKIARVSLFLLKMHVKHYVTCTLSSVGEHVMPLYGHQVWENTLQLVVLLVANKIISKCVHVVYNKVETDLQVVAV